MGVYEDLLEWSNTRPSWQRDALRRLVISGCVTDPDLDQLAALAMDEAVAPANAAVPLDATHLPGAETAISTVTLRAICDPRNLNAIAPDARLEFAPNGLTIVYGGNGAGKSGYVRLLKRVCRARSAPPKILPNLEKKDDRPTSAVVEFDVDGTAKTRSWTASEAIADELGGISVFDRACAAVYVRSENEVAYRPLGLDVFDAMAKCMLEVRRRLESRRSAAGNGMASPPVNILATPAVHGIWPVRADISAMELLDLAHWTADDEVRSELIAAALAAPSPQTQAAGLRARQSSLDRVRREVRSWEALLGDLAVDAYARLVLEKSDAEAALAQIRDQALTADPLPGVGAAVWRAMWDAAEAYSNANVYPGVAFPNSAEGARCVLCGQVLDEAARSRFLALKQLVETELGATVGRLRTALDSTLAGLDRIAIVAATDDLLGQVAECDAATVVGVRDLATTARRRAQEIRNWISGGTRPGPAEWPGEIAARLTSAITDLDNEIALLTAAGDATQAADLRTEALELQGRRWVHENHDSILGEVERVALIAKIGAAISTCDTQLVTRKGSELTDRYVTAKLEADFAVDSKALNTGRLRVKLRKHGEHGVTYHGIELEGAGGATAKVDEVVSDGEFGAIALAAFFAELAQGPKCSGIVLDDPVSSLDHRYRSKVATRLVKEASNRQVVVFTHDLVFLRELQSCAEDLGIPCEFRRLRPTWTHVGWPETGTPWLGMKVSDRIQVLQGILGELVTLYSAAEPGAYEGPARDWYGRLRETWERAIEEILFGDVVVRYRHDVQSLKLRSLRIWQIDEEDVRGVEAGMTRSSAWLRGHDQPAAVDEAVPEPDELRADLKALEDWVKNVKTKRKPPVATA